MPVEVDGMESEVVVGSEKQKIDSILIFRFFHEEFDKAKQA